MAGEGGGWRARRGLICFCAGCAMWVRHKLIETWGPCAVSLLLCTMVCTSSRILENQEVRGVACAAFERKERVPPSCVTGLP